MYVVNEPNVWHCIDADDWKSIFGDPTKFGLGAFSILFDLLFMLQHYVLFRGRQPYEKPGYSIIDEKAGNDSEKAPLVHSDEHDNVPTKEQESVQQQDCGAISFSKRFMRLLRLAWSYCVTPCIYNY